MDFLAQFSFFVQANPIAGMGLTFLALAVFALGVYVVPRLPK